MKKSIKLTAVTAVAALTLGMGATAFAKDVKGGPMGGPKGGMHKGGPSHDDDFGKGPRGASDGLIAVLAELVKAGTITQAQSDAISKAMVNAPAAAKAAAEAQKAAHEKLIADTVGLAWADIVTRLNAGETLAAIAGAKKDALVAALVKEATDRITADVAAGRLTEAQATVRKTGLTERIIAEISSVRKAPKAKGGNGTLTKPAPAPSASASTGATNAKSKGKVVVKQVKTTTTKKSA
jgi:hypothetical protein